MRAELRHKMKQDEFVSIFTRVTHSIAENPRRAITVVAVVCAVGLILGGAAFYRNYANARANTAYGKGLESLAGTVEGQSAQASAPKPDYSAALSSFEKVAGYRLSPLRDPARVMAAVCEAKLGKGDEAAKRLQALSASGRADFFTRMAKLLQAEALFGQGKYAEAARSYAELAQTNDPNFPTDYALCSSGIAQEKSGDRAAALATFKKTMVQYPLSPYAEVARNHVRTIAPEQAED